MGDELFQASTSQLSFEKFISTINQEQAKDLVRSINQFMKHFRKRDANSETDSKEVQDFLSTMEQAFSQHPLWTGSTREELDNAVEGLEKYLMTKLYDRTFGADLLDRERDVLLSRRLAALASFVTPAMLEVSRELQGPLAADEGGQVAAAQKELKRMALYKSPRDKLVQILNCCKIINSFITSRRSGAGADDFTPTLIYVTIKAQPEALASNLAFIERYRHANRLNGEASYFFVQMQGAVAFLETLTTSSLAGCDPDVFIAHMLAAGAMSEAELSPEQRDVQRQRAAAATLAGVSASAAHPPPPPPPPPPPTSAAAGTFVGSNPLANHPQQLNQPKVHVASPYPPGGAPYGTGTAMLAPQSLPQQAPPSYYAPGYPVTGPVQYVQGMPYYGQAPYGTQGAAVSYGQQWAAVGPQGPPPPPPPPMPAQPPPPPPPPSGANPAAAAASTRSQTSRFVPLPPKSASELEADGIRLVVRAEAAGELRARYRFLYSTPESLTLRDVSQLLASYKEIVLKYETLAQAVENNVLKYYSDLEAYQAGLLPAPPGTTNAPVSPTTAPPPPPPPPPPQVRTAEHRSPAPQYGSGAFATPQSPAAPPPPPPPPAPSGSTLPPPPPPPPTVPPPADAVAAVPVAASSSGAASVTSHGRTIDLSQYMPSYQLETEGYGAFTAAASGTGRSSGGGAAAAPPPPPPPSPPPQPAVEAPSNIPLAASFDLLGDEAPLAPPLPPPPPEQETEEGEASGVVDATLVARPAASAVEAVVATFPATGVNAEASATVTNPLLLSQGLNLQAAQPTGQQQPSFGPDAAAATVAESSDGGDGAATDGDDKNLTPPEPDTRNASDMDLFSFLEHAAAGSIAEAAAAVEAVESATVQPPPAAATAPPAVGEPAVHAEPSFEATFAPPASLASEGTSAPAEAEATAPALLAAHADVGSSGATPALSEGAVIASGVAAAPQSTMAGALPVAGVPEASGTAAAEAEAAAAAGADDVGTALAGGAEAGAGAGGVTGGELDAPQTEEERQARVDALLAQLLGAGAGGDGSGEGGDAADALSAAAAAAAGDEDSALEASLALYDGDGEAAPAEAPAGWSGEDGAPAGVVASAAGGVGSRDTESGGPQAAAEAPGTPWAAGGQGTLASGEESGEQAGTMFEGLSVETA